ncbi:MAG: DUF3784 domain-containing protein [Eubacterium sp.]
MIIVVILFIIFVVMGIVFLVGKGGFLIAGYNTADEKDKEKYDEKRLNKCFAIFCFGMAIIIGICGYVDTDSFALQIGLPVIIVLVGYIFIISNTYCKKK